MSYGPVEVDVVDGLATITLADAQRRNRLTDELMSGLGAALVAVGDASVRVVLLTGAGSVFCAGADLDGFGEQAPRRLGELLEQLATLPMPTIARVNGDAYGGGLGLIAACDLAVAPVSARFAFSEVRLGVTAAVIAPYCLRVMRPRLAAELMLTGQRVSATAMTDAGLLTGTAADEAQMDAQVADWVGLVRLGGPKALAATKRVLRQVAEMGSGAAEWVAELSAERFASAEAAEGIAAFRQRRLPDWAPPPP